MPLAEPTVTEGILNTPSRSSRVSEGSELPIQEALATMPYDATAANTTLTPVARLPARKRSALSLNSLLSPFRSNSMRREQGCAKKQPFLPKRPPRSPQDQWPLEPVAITAPYLATVPRSLFSSTNYPPRSSSFGALLRPRLEIVPEHLSTSVEACATYLSHNHDSIDHYDTAYCALSGDGPEVQPSIDQLEVFELGVQTPKQKARACKPGVRVESPKGLGLWYDDGYKTNGSFSTLPTTASKAALRPSPLKPHKDSLRTVPPPVPKKSPFRPICTLSKPCIESNRISNCKEDARPIFSLTRQSSYTTMSIYSSESDTSTLRRSDTPPSSPPIMPQRSGSRRDNAWIQAGKIRNDLGTIDDIYDMYVDAEKKQKHEAEIPGLAGHGIITSRSSSPFPSRTSLMQTRIARDRARKQVVEQGIKEVEDPIKVQARARAAQNLVSQIPDKRANDADFSRWLDFVARQDACRGDVEIDVMSFSDQHQITPTTTNDEVYLAGQRLSEILKEGEYQLAPALRKSSEQEATGSYRTERIKEEPGEPVPVAAEELFEAGDTDSKISLTQLRRHLQALMDDVQCTPRPDTQQNSPPQRPQLLISDGAKQSRSLSNDSNASSKSNSSSRQSIEYGPMNLQRIEIEWKGKRYPVLIGEHDRLWEAPCTNPNCTDHGKGWESLTGGMF